MKTTVTLCLDIDVALMLSKEKNKSALINSYLRQYYSIPSDVPKEKLKQKATETKEELAILSAKIESIETKEEDEKNKWHEASEFK